MPAEEGQAAEMPAEEGQYAEMPAEEGQAAEASPPPNANVNNQGDFAAGVLVCYLIFIFIYKKDGN